MIIAVEGHDGVGKTTLAKELAKAMNFQYIKHSASNLFGISEEKYIEISKSVIIKNNDIITATFLAVGDMWALEHFKDKDVILDRHTLLNYFWNGNEKTEGIFNYIINQFGKVDLTILLTASPEKRIERIKNRDKNDEDLKNVVMRSAGYDKMIDYLERYKLNYILIDTDNLTIEEVFKIVIEKINEYLIS